MEEITEKDKTEIMEILKYIYSLERGDSGFILPVETLEKYKETLFDFSKVDECFVGTKEIEFFSSLHQDNSVKMPQIIRRYHPSKKSCERFLFDSDIVRLCCVLQELIDIVSSSGNIEDEIERVFAYVQNQKQ